MGTLLLFGLLIIAIVLIIVTIIGQNESIKLNKRMEKELKEFKEKYGL